MDWISGSSNSSEGESALSVLPRVTLRVPAPEPELERRKSACRRRRNIVVDPIPIDDEYTKDYVSEDEAIEEIVKHLTTPAGFKSASTNLTIFERAVLAEVVSIAPPSVRFPEVVKEKQVSCGKDLPQIVKAMNSLREYAITDDNSFKMCIGSVGAVTMTAEQLYNSSFWTGEYCEPYASRSGGKHVIHGVSAKIDGVPLLPVTIETSTMKVSGVWILMGTQYVLRTCSWDLGSFAELRNGVVYTRAPLDVEISIGGSHYEVRESPVVLPGSIELLDDLVPESDGYIVHTGLEEYKVKDRRTVDLDVSAGKAYTSDGRHIFDAGVPDGLYEFDVCTASVVRSRQDKGSANSMRVYEKVLSAPVASELRSRLSRVPVSYRPCAFFDLFSISGVGLRLDLKAHLKNRSQVVWDVASELYRVDVSRLFASFFRRGRYLIKCD